MRRDFENLEEMIDYLRTAFPKSSHPNDVADIRGGRSQAVHMLENARLEQYDKTRNLLDGDVTRISPFLRHGVLSLAEVRDDALAQGAPTKFVNELGWRDYWQRKYAELEGRVWEDLEPYRLVFRPKRISKRFLMTSSTPERERAWTFSFVNCTQQAICITTPVCG